MNSPEDSAVYLVNEGLSQDIATFLLDTAVETIELK